MSQISQLVHVLNTATFLCHVVTWDARTFTHIFNAWRSHMQGHVISVRFSIIHLDSIKGSLMLPTMIISQVVLQCIWFKSIQIHINQNAIVAFIYSSDDRCARMIHLESIYSCAPENVQNWDSRLPSLRSIWTIEVMSPEHIQWAPQIASF